LFCVPLKVNFIAAHKIIIKRVTGFGFSVDAFILDAAQEARVDLQCSCRAARTWHVAAMVIKRSVSKEGLSYLNKVRMPKCFAVFLMAILLFGGLHSLV